MTHKSNPKKKRYKKFRYHTLTIGGSAIYVSKIINNGERIILSGWKINPSPYIIFKINEIIKLTYSNGSIIRYRIMDVQETIKNEHKEYSLICQREPEKIGSKIDKKCELCTWWNNLSDQCIGKPANREEVCHSYKKYIIPYTHA